jgi:glycosyltransferase involved in cell wall biosynthesis
MQQGRRLQTLGHRVSVIAPHEGETTYPVGQFFPLRGVTRASIHPLRRGFSSKIRRPLAGFDFLYFEHFRAAATPILRELQPDAVLTFNDWHTPHFVKKTLPRTRVFLRLSNECRTRMKNLRPAVNSIERIFALSTYIRDWTAREYNIAAGKFTLLPNGADLDSFFPAPDVFSRVLDPTLPVRALFLSRLDPNKGPDLAADAVQIVQNEGLNVQFSLAGAVWFRPDDNEAQNPFVQELRLKCEGVGAHILGHVERQNVPLLVRNHDVLLLPIRNHDPMTQVVFEAMASGLAVISCPLGGVPEACGEAALWAQPNDAASVAAHLRQLCQDRDFLVQRKKLALQRAQIMTWDNNSAIFNRVLKDTIS